MRGFTNEKESINYPLTVDGKTQDSKTDFSLIKHYEIQLPFGKFETSRYSHILVSPTTGRFHQIRKHMKHIFHPILGDRPHGCNKQNKLWLEKFGLTTMMLHAKKLSFEFPDAEEVVIVGERSVEFERTLKILEEMA